MNKGQSPGQAVAIVHRDKIIEDVAAGRKLKDIAAELGITRQAISLKLSNDPEYQAAQIAHHANRLDDAEDAIEGADDMLSLGRASAQWKAVSWRASVEQARVWGKQDASTGPVSIQVIIDTSCGQGKLIEHD